MDYYLHNNIFKMSKCFLPYLIYMIHPLCVISFCSFSSSQAQALFLNHDESSNGWLILKCNSFLALRQFCRICSVCRFILRAVSWVWCGWVDFKFQNIYVIVTSLWQKTSFEIYQESIKTLSPGPALNSCSAALKVFESLK